MRSVSLGSLLYHQSATEEDACSSIVDRCACQ
jgi:hypothetical protein